MCSSRSPWTLISHPFLTLRDSGVDWVRCHKSLKSRLKMSHLWLCTKRKWFILSNEVDTFSHAVFEFIFRGQKSFYLNKEICQLHLHQCLNDLNEFNELHPAISQHFWKFRIHSVWINTIVVALAPRVECHVLVRRDLELELEQRANLEVIEYWKPVKSVGLDCHFAVNLNVFSSTNPHHQCEEFANTVGFHRLLKNTLRFSQLLCVFRLFFGAGALPYLLTTVCDSL